MPKRMRHILPRDIPDFVSKRWQHFRFHFILFKFSYGMQQTYFTCKLCGLAVDIIANPNNTRNVRWDREAVPNRAHLLHTHTTHSMCHVQVHAVHRKFYSQGIFHICHSGASTRMEKILVAKMFHFRSVECCEWMLQAGYGKAKECCSNESNSFGVRI